MLKYVNESVEYAVHIKFSLLLPAYAGAGVISCKAFIKAPGHYIVVVCGMSHHIFLL